MLIWTDIETTGLDPTTDELLEVGIIVTDDDLNEIGRENWVIRHHSFTFTSPFVAKMHSNSGLLEECKSWKNTVAIEQLKDSFFRFLYRLEDKKEIEVRGSIMAGASVHFDREFLKTKVPELMDYYHYRNLDVSTIGRLAETWRPDLKEKAPQKREIHRALPDLEDSIELLKFYKENWLT